MKKQNRLKILKNNNLCLPLNYQVLLFVLNKKKKRSVSVTSSCKVFLLSGLSLYRNLYLKSNKTVLSKNQAILKMKTWLNALSVENLCLQKLSLINLMGNLLMLLRAS